MGIQNGKYIGFARIYVLATEIVAYTDNKITRNCMYLRYIKHQYIKHFVENSGLEEPYVSV